VRRNLTRRNLEEEMIQPDLGERNPTPKGLKMPKQMSVGPVVRLAIRLTHVDPKPRRRRSIFLS